MSRLEGWPHFAVGQPYHSWYNITQSGAAGAVDILLLGETFLEHPSHIALSSRSSTFSSVGNIVRFHTEGRGKEGLDNHVHNA